MSQRKLNGPVPPRSDALTRWECLTTLSGRAVINGQID
nr:MAG TPA: hypothetical protein [Caudoviricetes sp.]